MKHTSKILIALLVLMTMLMSMAVLNVHAEETTSTKVFDVAEFIASNEETAPTSGTTDWNGFTILWGSSNKFDSSGEFEDGKTYAKGYKTGGKTQTSDGTISGRAIKFVADSKSVVKVWWRCGGSGDRHIAICTEDNTQVATSSTDIPNPVDKGCYISEFTVEAGTYYLTAPVNNNGFYRIEVTPLCNHSWVDATCKAPKTCSLCNATDGQAVDHAYENGICKWCEVSENCAHPEENREVLEAKAPTCTETGLNEGSKCGLCGEIVVEQTTVDAKGHTEVAMEDVAPSCTNAGSKGGTKCSVCGETLTEGDEIEALGHKWSVTVNTAPTCTTEGNIDRKCETCETEEKGLTVPTKHEVVDGRCSECHAAIFVFEAIDLGEDEYEAANRSDEEAGTDYYFHLDYNPEKTVKIVDNKADFADGYASLRRLSFNAKTDFNKGGSYISFTTSGSATITVWWTCGGDGRYVDLLSEAVNPEVETVATKKDSAYISTFTVDAAGTYYLANVSGNNYFYKIVVAENHVAHSGEATCTEAAVCTVCGEEFADALGHDMQVVANKVAATCTSTGLTEGKACSRCDEKVEQKEVPMTRHLMVGATCTEAAHCVNCDYTEGEPTAHSYVDGECACGAKAPVEPQPELNFFEQVWQAILNFFKSIGGFFGNLFGGKE